MEGEGEEFIWNLEEVLSHSANLTVSKSADEAHTHARAHAHTLRGSCLFLSLPPFPPHNISP